MNRPMWWMTEKKYAERENMECGEDRAKSYKAFK